MGKKLTFPKEHNDDHRITVFCCINHDRVTIPVCLDCSKDPIYLSKLGGIKFRCCRNTVDITRQVLDLKLGLSNTIPSSIPKIHTTISTLPTDTIPFTSSKPYTLPFSLKSNPYQIMDTCFICNHVSHKGRICGKMTSSGLQMKMSLNPAPYPYNIKYEAVPNYIPCHCIQI